MYHSSWASVFLSLIPSQDLNDNNGKQKSIKIMTYVTFICNKISEYMAKLIYNWIDLYLR